MKLFNAMTEPDLVLRTDLSLEEAVRRAAAVFDAIGKRTRMDVTRHRVEGRLWALGRPVFVYVDAFVREEATELRIDAVGIELIGTGARDRALRHFADTFRLLDQPDFRAERKGPLSFLDFP